MTEHPIDPYLNGSILSAQNYLAGKMTKFAFNCFDTLCNYDYCSGTI